MPGKEKTSDRAEYDEVDGQDDAEEVADGDTGCADQETTREHFATGAADGIDGLPGNEHGNDGGPADASGEFEGDAKEFRIWVFVDGLEVGEELLAAFALLGGDLG